MCRMDKLVWWLCYSVHMHVLHIHYLHFMHTPNLLFDQGIPVSIISLCVMEEIGMSLHLRWLSL